MSMRMRGLGSARPNHYIHSFAVYRRKNKIAPGGRHVKSSYEETGEIIMDGMLAAASEKAKEQWKQTQHHISHTIVSYHPIAKVIENDILVLKKSLDADDETTESGESIESQNEPTNEPVESNPEAVDLDTDESSEEDETVEEDTEPEEIEKADSENDIMAERRFQVQGIEDPGGTGQFAIYYVLERSDLSADNS